MLLDCRKEITVIFHSLTRGDGCARTERKLLRKHGRSTGL